MIFSTALWQGEISHQRFAPVLHDFTYPLAMVMLDIDELSTTFARSRYWSLERFNLISFYRKDYLGRQTSNLKTDVKQQIFTQTGERFTGKVYLLTHPRYFGFVFNPVSFYFCVDEASNKLAYILAEINNTPWNQRHCYVIRCQGESSQRVATAFNKRFHVSPFMPMAMQYHWEFTWTDNELQIVMQLFRYRRQQFRADMTLQQQALTSRQMRGLPWRYPVQTVNVVRRIYWQALKLWWKKTPFYPNPDTGSAPVTTDIKNHENKS